MTTIRAQWAVVAVALLLPCAALAQSNVDQARRHADEGQAALQAGDFQRAYNEYKAAYDLFPSSLLLVNVARAASGLGHNAEAIVKLHQVLEDAALDAARRQEVVTEVARLRGLIVELELDITPAGSTILVNGTEVGTSPLSAPVPFDPGQLQVEARHEGHETGRWAGTLEAGAHRRVVIALDPVGETPGGEGEGEGEGELPPPPPPPSSGRSNTMLWVTGIGAAVTGVAALSLGALNLSRDASWDDKSPTFQRDHESSYFTLNVVADVLGGVAVVTGVVFVYLLATSGSADEAASTALAEPGIVRF